MPIAQGAAGWRSKYQPRILPLHGLQSFLFLPFSVRFEHCDHGVCQGEGERQDPRAAEGEQGPAKKGGPASKLRRRICAARLINERFLEGVPNMLELKSANLFWTGMLMPIVAVGARENSQQAAETIGLGSLDTPYT